MHCLNKYTSPFFDLFSPPSLSSSPAAVRLQLVLMMPPAGCLTCVRIRSCVYTLMIISSVASPLWPSPALAACCLPATMTLTVTSGTPWRETEQVNILALLFCGSTVTTVVYLWIVRSLNNSDLQCLGVCKNWFVKKKKEVKYSI